MTLKDLVHQAKELYSKAKQANRTNGSREAVLNNLTQVSEEQLAFSIIQCVSPEKRAEVGNTITRNLLDILRQTVLANYGIITPEQAKLNISQLKEDGLVFFPEQDSSWVSFRTTWPFSADPSKQTAEFAKQAHLEYKAFSEAACQYITEQAESKKQKEEKQAAEISDLTNKTSMLEQEKTAQASLVSKTDLTSLREEKETQLSPETTKKIIECLTIEAKFNNTLSSIGKTNPDIVEIHRLLSTILSNILTSKLGEHAEKLAEITHPDFINKITQHLQSSNISIVGTLPFVKATSSTKNQFYLFANEIIALLQGDALNELPRNISTKILAHYKEIIEIAIKVKPRSKAVHAQGQTKCGSDHHLSPLDHH